VDELLDCPFCVGKPGLKYNESTLRYMVQCHDCRVLTCWDYNSKDVISVWNKRTLPKGVTGYLTIHPEVLESWKEDFD
jgi:hypothetical protein